MRKKKQRPFFIFKMTSCKFSLNLTRSAMTLGEWESENWMERKWMKDTDSERAQGKTDQQGWKRSTKERSIQGRWRPGGHGSFSRRTDSDKAQLIQCWGLWGHQDNSLLIGPSNSAGLQIRGKDLLPSTGTRFLISTDPALLW